MKKIMLLSITIFLFIISCKPSVVTDAKIEAKYSYTSDQKAIQGIFVDIYEVERKYLDSNSMEEITEYLSSGFFDEEKEIGEWLKIKFGSEIRKGEAIKIIYTYDKEYNGFDILYRPYNKDVFPINIISNYDFITILGNNGNESLANDNSPPVKPTANNSSSSPQNTQISTNRLANTKWQYVHKYPQRDAEYTITFGQTSFSYTSDGTIWSGSYTTSGDTINFTYEGFSKTVKETGALIGNELTAFGNKFRRIE
jgi:hypothetical protein